MRQRFAVTPDRGQKPAEPEDARVASGAADAFSDQDRQWLDLVEERIGCFMAVRMCHRIHNPPEAFRILVAENDKLAVAELEQRRFRDRGQPRHIDVRNDAGLETEQIGGAHQVRRVGATRLQRQIDG